MQDEFGKVYQKSAPYSPLFKFLKYDLFYFSASAAATAQSAASAICTGLTVYSDYIEVKKKM